MEANIMNPDQTAPRGVKICIYLTFTIAMVKNNGHWNQIYWLFQKILNKQKIICKNGVKKGHDYW